MSTTEGHRAERDGHEGTSNCALCATAVHKRRWRVSSSGNRFVHRQTHITNSREHTQMGVRCRGGHRTDKPGFRFTVPLYVFAQAAPDRQRRSLTLSPTTSEWKQVHSAACTAVRLHIRRPRESEAQSAKLRCPPDEALDFLLHRISAPSGRAGVGRDRV